MNNLNGCVSIRYLTATPPTFQDFQLDVYLQQFWKDPRLAHNETSRILIRDRLILDRIWHPDVYFAKSVLKYTVNVLGASGPFPDCRGRPKLNSYYSKNVGKSFILVALIPEKFGQIPL